MGAVVGTPVGSIDPFLRCSDAGDQELQPDGFLAIWALDKEGDEQDGCDSRDEKGCGQKEEEEEVECFAGFEQLGQNQADDGGSCQQGCRPHHSTDFLAEMFPLCHFNLFSLGEC